MADLDVTYAGIDYLDRTRPLFDGTAKPAGVTLRFIPLRPFELFRRVAQYDEFGAAEMSFSTYANLLSRGDARYIAIPFFPSRYFRHADFYVHRDSGIERPEDLRGQRVGIAEYQMTAALWQRAHLQYDYGVHAREIQWFTGGLKTPGYTERNETPSPPGVSIELIPEDRTLEEMATAGELAALISPIRPSAMTDGSGRLRRLFPNYRQVEREYYARTGFFPIMHLVVVRRALYEEHRWLAVSLLNAFVQAQRLGWERLNRTEALQIALPWLVAEMEATTALLGADHWRPGFKQNYAMLQTMCGYHYEQGLSERRVTPEEMFAPETHELPLTY